MIAGIGSRLMTFPVHVRLRMVGGWAVLVEVDAFLLTVSADSQQTARPRLL